MYVCVCKVGVAISKGIIHLRNRVVVDVDDSVEVPSDDLGDLKQRLEIKLPLRDKAVEGNGGQVTDSHLIR